MKSQYVMIALLAMIIAVVLSSGCTSGPATNATAKKSPTATTVKPTTVPVTNINTKTVHTTDINGVTQDSGMLNASATPLTSPVPMASNNSTNTTGVIQHSHDEAIKGMILNKTPKINSTHGLANVSS